MAKNSTFINERSEDDHLLKLLQGNIIRASRDQLFSARRAYGSSRAKLVYHFGVLRPLADTPTLASAITPRQPLSETEG